MTNFFIIGNNTDSLKENLSNFQITTDINKADAVLAFGGDGTLIDTFAVLKNNNCTLPIIPIRNYSRCNKHINLLQYINYIYKNTLLTSEHMILTGYNNQINNVSLSEITIKNNDITQAIRFDVCINDKVYASNVIGDGLIICTKLGSTGYFKSVSNTIFKSGIGIGFINSTQHINNLVLEKTDIIKVIIRRGDAIVAFDKTIPYNNIMKDNSEIIINAANEYQTLIGYDTFMCQACRNLRHSAQINDIFSTL